MKRRREETRQEEGKEVEHVVEEKRRREDGRVKGKQCVALVWECGYPRRSTTSRLPEGD